MFGVPVMFFGCIVLIIGIVIVKASGVQGENDETATQSERDTMTGGFITLGVGGVIFLIGFIACLFGAC